MLNDLPRLNRMLGFYFSLIAIMVSCCHCSEPSYTDRPGTGAVADTGSIVHVLNLPLTHPIAKFEIPPPVRDIPAFTDRAFMLRENAWYYEAYIRLTGKPGYRVLYDAIMNDSAALSRDYTSALFLASPAPPFSVLHYDFAAAVFFNEQSGVIYWAKLDSSRSFVVPSPVDLIPAIVEVARSKPSSRDEGRSSNGNGFFVSILTPNGSRTFYSRHQLPYHLWDKSGYPQVSVEDFHRLRRTDSMIWGVVWACDSTVRWDMQR